MEGKFIREDWLDSYLSAPIMDTKYRKADIDQVIYDLLHLSDSQKAYLRALLTKHKILLNGTLCCYSHREVHIEIDKDAIPIHAHPYPVPHVYLGMFKR